MAEKFENILNECLDRLLRGESVEQCMERYPDQAQQLEPLLRAAQEVQEAASVEPRPSFKAQSRYQIRSLLQERQQKRQPARIPFFSWLPRWATATVIGVLILLVIGSGTVAAASNSLPGDTLYPVKLAREQVQCSLAFSGVAKAKLQAICATRRATEIARLSEIGRPERIAACVTRFQNHLKTVEQLAPRITEGNLQDQAQIAALKQQLSQNAQRDMKTLKLAEGMVSGQANLVIRGAQERLQNAYDAALAAFNGRTDECPPAG